MNVACHHCLGFCCSCGVVGSLGYQWLCWTQLNRRRMVSTLEPWIITSQIILKPSCHSQLLIRSTVRTHGFNLLGDDLVHFGVWSPWKLEADKEKYRRIHHHCQTLRYNNSKQINTNHTLPSWHANVDRHHLSDKTISKFIELAADRPVTWCQAKTTCH